MLSCFKNMPGKTFDKNLSLSKKESPQDNSYDDITTVFRDLHVSAFSKAASISPSVRNVTLGINSSEGNVDETFEDSLEENQECLPSSVLHSSTPEKSKSSCLSNKKEFKRMRQKVDNLSPIIVEKNAASDNIFSHQKLLNEFDVQRRLTVDKVMRERIQNMYDTGKLIRESLEHLKQTRQEEAIARRLMLERKILDDIHKQEILNKPKREAQWAKDNLKEAQRIQERNQRVKEAEEEARKKSESMLIKRKQIDQILMHLQKEYNKEYKDLLECIKSCKDKAALTDFTAIQSKFLKECNSTCEKILKKCKQNDVGEEDVESAKKLVETIKCIHEVFAKEISRINESVNAKKEESKKKAEETPTQENPSLKSSMETSTLKSSMDTSNLKSSMETSTLKFSMDTSHLKPFMETSTLKSSMDTSTLNSSIDTSNLKSSMETSSLKSSVEAVPEADLSDCFDTKTLETYLKLKAVLENCEKNIEPLLIDDSMKKFRFSCQKAVNIPVNAISPISGPHLCDKYLKLQNLLSGRPVEVGDVKITATQHPLGILYCKYLLAKKFVRQGDLTVSSKPDAAFSIAAVLASLWLDFPDFGQLVLAHFQAACPYLAPVFLPQVEKQSVEEYHRSLGYHYSQTGEVEKQDSFLKRMSGIMRLYSALLISNVRQPGKMNPLGLSEGWRWISALLNLEPRPDICATLLYDFLDVAGNEMFRAYGAQFKKLLAYICQEYFPKLEKVTPSGAGGPMVRLEGFLQKILKEESIPPPQGVLPPNFW